jgi:glycosyltransferase involved in cell wall biosynthesis
MQHIAAVSRYVRDKGVSEGVLPEHADVIYNGVELDQFYRPIQRKQRSPLRLLYAGRVSAGKGVHTVMEALKVLVRDRGLDHVKLVVIGDQISKYAALRRAVHRHQLHQYVRFLGYVSEETLAVMYRLAAVFVFPSLYEGFGLPPLEAMASGTPVVTSNVSSLPEVAGDAALLINPYEPAAIADAMYRVLTDEPLRRSLREKGLRRAAQFSWEASARRVREIYQEVGEAPAAHLRAKAPAKSTGTPLRRA